MKPFYSATLLLAVLPLVSCDDYLDVVPKGKKIPTTYADFEAFLRDEYGTCRVDPGQTTILMNERYVSPSSLSYYPLWSANYNWDESADRIDLNKDDETAYYQAYSSISTYNLILEHADELTECNASQRDELVAQARVLRAMTYFNLANYYCDTYQTSTAAQKGGVPVITSANLGASYTQPSLQEVYDFILADMAAAYPKLPRTAATILHPSIAAADAFYARLYLQMGRYEEAMASADKALQAHSDLYDWRAFYAAHADAITDPKNRTRMTDPAGMEYCENYLFRHGASSNRGAEQGLPLWRGGDRFETGDSRAAARWKLYNAGNDTYYYATLTGYHNIGGITTTEVYLIKAECLARSGRVAEAMTALNAVRESRILADQYQPLSAASEAEAMQLIMRTKQNEMILTPFNFNDARRLNLEGKYPQLPTKVIDGKTTQLSATSHLWTFSFPQGAVDNPGNGTIKQNVTK